MQSIRFSPLEIQATRDYWTAERIANATPAPLLGMKMPEGRQQKYDEFSQAEREMCFCASGSSGPNLVTNVNEQPFQQAGRLYYVTAEGIACYATAQFVGENNILMTAAQCLKDANSGKKERGWSTNILFQRACEDDKSAQDTAIVVGSAYVPPEWGFGNGFNVVKYDYGFAKTVVPSKVGCLDFPLYLGIPTNLTAIGYPKNYGNDQRFMYSVRGKRGVRKDGVIQMVGNDMDAGAVGGAWFQGKVSLRSKIIYGINSWLGSDGSVFGPVFSQRMVNKMNELKNEALPFLTANDVDDFFASL